MKSKWPTIVGIIIAAFVLSCISTCRSHHRAKATVEAYKGWEKRNVERQAQSTTRKIAEQRVSEKRASPVTPKTHHTDSYAGTANASSLLGGCNKCGGSKTITIRCTTCGGNGLGIMGDCISCNGTGSRRARCTACQTVSSQGASSSGYNSLFGGCSKCGGSKTVTVRCTTCGGNGLGIMGECISCNGTGTRRARCTACQTVSSQGASSSGYNSLFGGCSKCGGSKTVTVRCTTCGGNGLGIMGDCISCNGTGTRRARCTACSN